MVQDRMRLFATISMGACLVLAGVSVSSVRAQEGDEPAATDPSEMEGAFLLREPETPEDYLRAALQAQELARPKLARIYLERFQALEPSDEVLLEIREKLGQVPFQKLANQKELQPISTAIAARAAQLFRERGATPEHLNRLIDQLSGSSDESFAAKRALINTGTLAIPTILSRIQSDEDASVQPQLIEILTEMGPKALPAMHAALEADDNAIRIPVLAVIGEIGSRRSIPYVYKIAYGPGASVELQRIGRQTLATIAATSRAAAEDVEPTDVSLRLREAALRVLDPNVKPADEAAADEAAKSAAIWVWDPAEPMLKQLTIPKRRAGIRQAMLFARDAFRVSPEREEAQAFYLATRLELEAAREGTFEPPGGQGTALGVLLASGPDLSQQTLRQSIETGLPRATVGALGVLAQIGSPNLLFGGETALRDSLNASHPRVQLAAAVAVLRIDPDRKFSDAPRIVEILTRALVDTNARTAIIIDPKFEEAAALAGFARQMGYDAMAATTGQQGFRLATERAVPSFVLVNLNVDQWTLSQTIANFRADTRTQAVPIIVVGPGEGIWDVNSLAGAGYVYHEGPADHDPRGEVRRLLAGIPQTGYIIKTTSYPLFFEQLSPILAAQLPAPLSDDDKLRTREIAAYWLAQIADRGLTERYPLAGAEQALEEAVSNPKLTNNALIALSAIPTATAQTAIAGTFLSGGASESARTLAAETLTDHIRRYGLLISDDMAGQVARDPGQAQAPALRRAVTALSGLIHSRAQDVPGRLRQLPPVALPAGP